jgi:hypothetical protein
LRAKYGVREAGLSGSAFGMTLMLASNLLEDGSGPDDPDLAKASVMAELARIVEEGGALIVMLESGTLELRLATGEVFLLGEKAVTRIA